MTGVDEIPSIEKNSNTKDLDDKQQKGGRLSNVVETNEDDFNEMDEYNEYNEEVATTTWSIGLVINMLLNGLIWFCAVLSMYYMIYFAKYFPTELFTTLAFEHTASLIGYSSSTLILS